MFGAKKRKFRTEVAVTISYFALSVNEQLTAKVASNFAPLIDHYFGPNNDPTKAAVWIVTSSIFKLVEAGENPIDSRGLDEFKEILVNAADAVTLDPRFEVYFSGGGVERLREKIQCLSDFKMYSNRDITYREMLERGRMHRQYLLDVMRKGGVI